MREYMLCLFAAAAVTYFLTPPVRALAFRWGIIAPVRDRDVHETPTPRLGGLAMAGGLLAGFLLASKLDSSVVSRLNHDRRAALRGGHYRYLGRNR